MHLSYVQYTAELKLFCMAKFLMGFEPAVSCARHWLRRLEQILIDHSQF
jgi:hypothetical protein